MPLAEQQELPALGDVVAEHSDLAAQQLPWLGEVIWDLELCSPAWSEVMAAKAVRVRQIRSFFIGFVIW